MAKKSGSISADKESSANGVIAGNSFIRYDHS
jgi:hypothetical protein